MGPKMGFTVATDLVEAGAPSNEGFMAKTWLKAAGRKGLPTTFIVDGAGRIAWVGHTLDIDDPIKKVVAGSWSIEDFIALNRTKWSMEAKADSFQTRVKELVAKDRLQEALEFCEQAYAEGDKEGFYWKFRILFTIKKDIPSARKFLDASLKDPAIREAAALNKFSMLTRLGYLREAAKFADECITKHLESNTGALNLIAKLIIDPTNRFPRPDYALALKACELSVSLDDKRVDSWVTKARALFASGDKTGAISCLEKAISLSPAGEAEPLRKLLRDYRQPTR
jgi:tetratricopeptide (TPR) repeat protein